MVTQLNLNGKIISELFRSILKGNNTQQKLIKDLKIEQSTLSERIKLLKHYHILESDTKNKFKYYKINYQGLLLYGLYIFKVHPNEAMKIIKDNPLAPKMLELFINEYYDKKIYLQHTSFLIKTLSKKDGLTIPTRPFFLEDYLRYFAKWFRENGEALDALPHSKIYRDTDMVVENMRDPNTEALKLTPEIMKKYNTLRQD
jgi:hypothetical protein